MIEKLKTLKDLESIREIEGDNRFAGDVVCEIEELRQEAIKICRMNLLELTKIFPNLSASQLTGMIYYLKWFYTIENSELNG